MGLLDSLDDPQKQALMTMALGLMAPKDRKTSFLNDVGTSGLLGMQALGTAQQQERTNRASDLQQLSGAYNMLKQQEFGKMLAAKQAGSPYTPNPMLPQMENRLAQLTGLGNLSGKFGLTPAPQAPQASQAPPAPSMPPSGMAPPSQSPMASPDYQPSQVRPQPAQAPQARQQDSSGLGGPAGGVPMEAWLAMDPTGAKYMEQLAKDNQPVVLRQGDLVGKNPDGSYKSLYQQPQSVPGVLPNRNGQGQVESFREGPGFAQAASNIKGAETGAVASAEDPHTMVTVTLADGRTVPVPRSALLGKAAPGGLPMVTPQGQPPTAKLTVTQPSQQSNDPWASLPKVSIPQGMGQSTSQRTLDELRSQKIKALSDQFSGESDSASQRIALNSQARDMVDHADTGWLANHLSEFRNVLGTLGVPSQKDQAGNDQVLAKDLVQTAVTRGKQMFGSRFTQSEVGLMLTKGSPSPEMQKVAIKFLLDTDNASQQYNIQRGNDFGRFVSEGGDALSFGPWYAQHFPVSKSVEKVLPPGKTANVSDLVEKYRTR